MVSKENLSYYALICSIFYGFGFKWCYEYAKGSFSLKKKEGEIIKKDIKFCMKCESMFTNKGCEALIKLIILLLAFFINEQNCFWGYETSSKITAVLMCFLLNAFVEVVNFLYPHIISDGLVKIALAQSFFIEGFLFLWTGDNQITTITIILAGIVWTKSLAIILELVWPEMKLLRAYMTFLHGAWIIYMHSMESYPRIKVLMDLSTFICLVFFLILFIVGFTKKLLQKLVIEEPPAEPVNDCDKAV